MGFKELLVSRLRGEVLEDKLDLLPKGYQKVGHMVIVNFREGLEEYWEKIGSKVLEIVNGVRTVCAKTDVISGEFRRPSLKVIAGEDNTLVENFENGVWFVYDASKIMFAKGNVNERGRLPEQVKEGEVIVDMFIGIGYFSVPIAKIAKPKKIYGIDLNEDSIYWLKKTIEKNKLDNIEVIQGDSKLEITKLIDLGVKADRVIMGYLPPPKGFIPYAVKIVKGGGMIHYDSLICTQRVEEEIERDLNLFRLGGIEVELINAKRVKGYGPKIDHYVLDIKIIKK